MKVKPFRLEAEKNRGGQNCPLRREELEGDKIVP